MTPPRLVITFDTMSRLYNSWVALVGEQKYRGGILDHVGFNTYVRGKTRASMTDILARDWLRVVVGVKRSCIVKLDCTTKSIVQARGFGAMTKRLAVTHLIFVRL